MDNDWKMVSEWRGPRHITSNAESRPSDDDTLTVGKLQAMKRMIERLPPDPMRGARMVRCSDKTMADARVLAGNQPEHMVGTFAGIPVTIIEDNNVPDGYIVGMKAGKFGPEVAFIIGPEKPSPPPSIGDR